VYENYQYRAFVRGDAELSFVDQNVADGSTRRYSIRAQDDAGNVSALSPRLKLEIDRNSEDTEAPSTPEGTKAEQYGDYVELSWLPSTDNVGVVGYLIHDNYQYLAYSRSTTYNHRGLGAGEVHRYQVRAKDAAGNVSGVRDRLKVTIDAS